MADRTVPGRRTENFSILARIHFRRRRLFPGVRPSVVVWFGSPPEIQCFAFGEFLDFIRIERLAPGDREPFIIIGRLVQRIGWEVFVMRGTHWG